MLVRECNRVRQERLVVRLTSEIVLRERTEATAALRSGVLSQLEDIGPEVVQVAAALEAQVAALGDLGPALEPFANDVLDLHRVSARFTELLASLRGDAGPAEPECATIGALVAAARAMLPSSAVGAISLEEGSGLEVMGMTTDLGRVVWNLMGNALQAMEASGVGGRLRLRASSDHTFVVLHVEDDGPGMAEDVAARAFEPYFTTRADSGGTGLGLAICRELAIQNGGGLTIANTRPGLGTTFALRMVAARVA